MGRCPPGGLRSLTADGRCPRFIPAAAVLAVTATEIVKHGDCRMTPEHIATVAAVSRSTVKAALRHARLLGLITVEDRQRSAWRGLSDVVRIVSRTRDEIRARDRLAGLPPSSEGSRAPKQPNDHKRAVKLACS